MLYERIVDSRLLVRRLTVIADDVATPEELAAGKRYEQLDLFGDDEAQSYGSDSTSEKDGEHDIQRALLDVKRKFGRNAVIKAMDMEDGATGQDRNRQIGGHRAGPCKRPMHTTTSSTCHTISRASIRTCPATSGPRSSCRSRP